MQFLSLGIVQNRGRQRESPEWTLGSLAYAPAVARKLWRAGPPPLKLRRAGRSYGPTGPDLLSMNRMASRRFCGVRGHVRALFRRDTSRRGKRRHVAALQDAAAAIGSWSQCMRKVERRLSMNRGTSNIEHPMKAEDRKRTPHPGPLPVWRGEGEAAAGRAAARPYPVRSAANRPCPVGRVTPPDIGCRGPCAPPGDP